MCENMTYRENILIRLGFGSWSLSLQFQAWLGPMSERKEEPSHRSVRCDHATQRYALLIERNCPLWPVEDCLVVERVSNAACLCLPTALCLMTFSWSDSLSCLYHISSRDSWGMTDVPQSIVSLPQSSSSSRPVHTFPQGCLEDSLIENAASDEKTATTV